MKKFFFLPIIAAGLLSFSGCEDDSTDPLPNKVNGQFVALDIHTKLLDFNNVNNTAFTGTFTNPSNDIVKYVLKVRRSTTDASNTTFITSDYVDFETFTSFPAELNVTPQKLATALGVDVSELKDGDFFRFFGYSYNAAGVEVRYQTLSRNVQVQKWIKQGYRFNTTLQSNQSESAISEYNNRSE